MIDGEIQCIYDVNDVHMVLSVKQDYRDPGCEIYGLAEMFIKIIVDNNYNPEIIIDHMKEHFAYENDNEG